MTNVEDLTPDQIKKYSEEIGSTFGYGDRLFGSLTDDNIVSLAWSLEPRELAEMLADDGNARKIERVLSLPIRGAPIHIIGSGPVADLIRENVGPMLSQMVEQCTGAIVYRRTYFEKVWTTNQAGQFVYEKVAWRPPASCIPRFDRQTGVQEGFYQRIADAGWWVLAKQKLHGEEIPGQITIPKHKSFVYTHGKHREPVKGVSDLEVAYNAYTKKRKLKFLWAQYLENQSLPKVAVFGRDAADAQRNGEQLARARASGIVPMVRQPDAGDPFTIIESSGRGADQFESAIRYYDWEQTNSVLAGFTELANSTTGTGSYALSTDQSEFFLASEQAVADEIADQIIEGIFRPLAVLNFGPDVEVPGMRIGPIGRQQTDRALKLLQSIVTATRPTVPYEFIGFLLTQVSEALGLDTSDVAGAVEAWSVRMQAEMEAAFAAQVAAAGQPKNLRNAPAQPPLGGLDAATAAEKSATPEVKPIVNKVKVQPVNPQEDTSVSRPSDPTPVNRMKPPARTPSKRDKRRQGK